MLHVPHGVFPYDLAVAPQSGRRPQPGNAVLKATPPESERADQLGRDLLDESEGRPTGRPDLGSGLDSGEIARVTAGESLLPATSYGELRHTHADNQQQH
jgi:hypothetical protein